MSDSILDEPIRLTQFSHGGGCGCKIAPAGLRDILADTPFASHMAAAYPDLLVGIEHAQQIPSATTPPSVTRWCTPPPAPARG